MTNDKIIKLVRNKLPDGAKIIMLTEFGSHMYGTNTENSDKDYMGVYIPPLKELLLGTAPNSITFSTGDDMSKNTSDDVDIEMISLSRFIVLGVIGETHIIDMLHGRAESVICDSYTWAKLRKNRHMFFTNKMKSYLGYCKRQAHKYGIKGSRLAVYKEILDYIDNCPHNSTTKLSAIINDLPKTEYTFVKEFPYHADSSKTINYYVVMGKKHCETTSIFHFYNIIKSIYDTYGARAKLAQENKGIDWKAIHHAFRAGYQLKHIFIDGSFEYPLPENDFLMQIKNGELNFNDVNDKLEQLMNDVIELSQKSEYPDVVDHKFWEELLYNEYINTYEEINYV